MEVLFSEEPSESITGREFEDKIADRLEVYKSLGSAHIGRYGVQVLGSPDPTHPSGTRWTPLRSLPDYEGALHTGQQVIFDAKVVSAASLSLSEYRWEGTGSKSKSRQLRHMLDRSLYNVGCYLLIHWNPRAGKTFATPPETYLFPVRLRSQFWQAFVRAEVKSISLKDCQELGARVQWNRNGRERSARPDVLPAIEHELKGRVGNGEAIYQSHDNGNRLAADCTGALFMGLPAESL